MAGEVNSGKLANCLIVSANEVVTPYPVYPLGAAYVAGALAAAAIARILQLRGGKSAIATRHQLGQAVDRCGTCFFKK